MSEITFIAGGATAAQGFSATGEHMGIRRNRTRRDVALIVSEVPANAACVYTQNLVKGAKSPKACAPWWSSTSA